MLPALFFTSMNYLKYPTYQNDLFFNQTAIFFKDLHVQNAGKPSRFIFFLLFLHPKNHTIKLNPN